MEHVGLERGSFTPGCPPIFLGPDIGFVDIFEYNDEDGSCTLRCRTAAPAHSQELLRNAHALTPRRFQHGGASVDVRGFLRGVHVILGVE